MNKQNILRETHRKTNLNKKITVKKGNNILSTANIQKRMTLFKLRLLKNKKSLQQIDGIGNNISNKIINRISSLV